MFYIYLYPAYPYSNGGGVHARGETCSLCRSETDKSTMVPTLGLTFLVVTVDSGKALVAFL